MSIWDDSMSLIPIDYSACLGEATYEVLRAANLTRKLSGEIVTLLNKIPQIFYQGAVGTTPVLRDAYREDRVFSDAYRAAAWQFARRVERMTILPADWEDPHDRVMPLLLRLDLVVGMSWRVRRAFLDEPTWADVVAFQDKRVLARQFDWPSSRQLPKLSTVE